MELPAARHSSPLLRRPRTRPGRSGRRARPSSRLRAVEVLLDLLEDLQAAGITCPRVPGDSAGTVPSAVSTYLRGVQAQNNARAEPVNVTGHRTSRLPQAAPRTCETATVTGATGTLALVVRGLPVRCDEPPTRPDRHEQRLPQLFFSHRPLDGIWVTPALLLCHSFGTWWCLGAAGQARRRRPAAGDPACRR